jgi:two-component system sensor kinase FixL
MMADHLSQSPAAPRAEILDEAREAGLILLFGGAVALLCRMIPVILMARQRADEQARKALESEAWTRAIVDTAGEGIITIDDRGIITSFNPAAATIFGYRADEVIGNGLNLLIPSPYPENDDRFIDRYMGTEHSRLIGIRREAMGQRKDGSVVPLEIVCSDVRLPGRRMLTCVVQDISARVRAEEQARQREIELNRVSRLATMGEMASGLAHEINQPLAAIVNYLQACQHRIQAGERQPDRLLADLDRAAAQAERAGAIIDRIRNFIQEREPQRMPVDVNAVVREAADLLKCEARRTGAGIRLELDEALPAVSADPVQIEQVLVNVMRNGLEAMAGHGNSNRQLTVRTAKTGSGSIECITQDTGPGLPHGDVARIFAPFFTTKRDGLGLGLPISQTIVEAFGGRMWAASASDRGAKICFMLPIDSGDVVHAITADSIRR